MLNKHKWTKRKFITQRETFRLLKGSRHLTAADQNQVDGSHYFSSHQVLKLGMPVPLWPSSWAMEIFSLVVKVNWNCNQWIENTRLEAVVCWEMICCPLPGGWTRGSGGSRCCLQCKSVATPQSKYAPFSSRGTSWVKGCALVSSPWPWNKLDIIIKTWA